MIRREKGKVLEHFKKYLNRGRDLNGLSVENPQLYRWWYRDVKDDEIPMYGSKTKKDAVQVPIEDIEEETYELPEVFDYEIKDAISNALSKLTPREQLAIKGKYFDDLTLGQIGWSFSQLEGNYGVSEERARQILSKALRKLRHPSMGLKEVA